MKKTLLLILALCFGANIFCMKVALPSYEEACHKVEPHPPLTPYPKPFLYIHKFEPYHWQDSRAKLCASSYSNHYLMPLYQVELKFDKPITREISNRTLQFLQRYGQCLETCILFGPERDLYNLDNHNFRFDTFMNKKKLQALIYKANSKILE